MIERVKQLLRPRGVRELAKHCRHKRCEGKRMSRTGRARINLRNTIRGWPAPGYTPPAPGAEWRHEEYIRQLRASIPAAQLEALSRRRW